MAQPAPAVICLTASGAETAAKVADAIGGQVHGLEGRVPAGAATVPFAAVSGHVQTLFAAGVPIIGVCAAGILVRCLAPAVADKHSEPPVIAVAEDGSATVPLLGGHHGGNDLARRIAAALGGRAAITTAGDLAFGVALDAPPPGWVLANPGDAKPAMAALLSGARLRVEGDLPWAAAMPPSPDPSPQRGEGGAKGGGVTLAATLAPEAGGADRLVYHPQRLVLGLGASRNCPPEEMWDAIQAALAEADIAPAAIAAVATVDLKADEPAILAAAARLGVPLRLFDAARLEQETPRLRNPSDVVFAEIGCHGVAEAAALAGAGPAARLVVAKRKTAHGTVALAEAPAPITALPGRKRGRVSIVGIGPGQAAWRTPEASGLIAAADELVGYGLYLDLLGPLAAGKPRRDFPLGAEEDRCRYALERAGEGVDVALISSGDAGIYAMGALVYELLGRQRAEGGVSDAARRVDVVSAPGITAMQAAAARAGAPLGHDFCAISLSDLLTPRGDILRRLHAAAEGDFVIAFYNPVSARRRTLLAEARDILLRHRHAGTPVLLASNLGRDGEDLRFRTLESLTVDEVDMLTVVIVGAAASRRLDRGDGPRMFTPRGYARKRAEAPA